MYAINPNSRFTLITPDECTAKMPNNSLDSSKWKSAIELAEARFVLPLLGHNLYIDICSKKNIYVTYANIDYLQTFFTVQFGINPSSGEPNVKIALNQIVNAIELPSITEEYLKLWNEALWNFVFNCVYFVALTENYAQFTNSGVQKSNPVDSALGENTSKNVGISLSDLRYLNDRFLFDRITPLQEYLEQFICYNQGSYPQYTSCNCNKWDKENKIKRNTSFINMYEDEDNGDLLKNIRRRNCNNNCPTPPQPSEMKQTCSISVKIKAIPDDTKTYMLCNLQSIKSEYPTGNTLQLLNLIGKYVNIPSQRLNGNNVELPFNSATGTFDNTDGGGFNDGDVFDFLYTETM